MNRASMNLMITAVMGLCFGATATGAEKTSLTIKKAGGPITIDGALDDPGWKGAAGFGRFVYAGTDTPDYRKARGTLAYDGKGLYLGVECEQDNKGLAFSEPTKEEAPVRGPHLKIWIDAGHAKGDPYRNALRFDVNCLGARFDELTDGGSKAFDGKWVSAGKRKEGRWSIEMAVPFKDLGLEGPPIGLPIGMEIARGTCPLVGWAGCWGHLAERRHFGLVFFENDGKYPREKAEEKAPAAKPRTLYVDPKGDDGNPGDSNKPFKNVQKAVDVAGPGDRVIVRPGLYRGRLMIKGGGLPEKPLTIEGQRGAILHGGDLATGWEHMGNGLYKKEGLPYQPYCMVWNDRFVLYVRSEFQKEYVDATKLYFQGQPEPKDWDGVEVLFSSLGGTAWVRSRNGDDPNQQEVTLAPRCYDIGGGTVNLHDASHVIVRGFVIKGGDAGVYMSNSTDNVVERSVIQHGKNGVLLHYGTHRNVIRDNYITMRTFGTMNRFKATKAGIRNVVRIIKGDGRRDHHGILLLYAGHDNEFAYNTIYEHWDGVKACVYMTSGGDPEVVAKEKRIQSQLYGRGFKVHHNIIRDCWDYGIEPCGGEVDAEYHHNLLHDNYGSRIKSIGTGPAYFYKNFYACPSRRIAEIDERILDPDSPPRAAQARCCFYISNPNECRLYVYHNTFAGLRGINLSGRIPRYSKNWWFVNNILSNAELTLSAQTNKSGSDFHVHYSYLSTTSPRGLREDAAGNVLNAKVLWERGTPGMFSDFRIGRDWPVREKGLDLSQPWELDGVKHPPLPGLEKGYFTGEAPDLGALQFGEDMPHIGPRW